MRKVPIGKQVAAMLKIEAEAKRRFPDASPDDLYAMCERAMTAAMRGGMYPIIPPDLKTEAQRQAYARGWNDRGAEGAARAGSVTSEAKAAAVRANGAKGGRPKKKKEGT